MRRFLLALAAMLYVLNFQITPTAQHNPKRVKLFERSDVNRHVISMSHR